MAGPSDGRAWLTTDGPGLARNTPDTERDAASAPAPPLSPVALKAARYAILSGRSPRRLKWAEKPRRRFKAGTQLVRQGEAGGRAFVIHQGWTCSSATLSNGNRQVCNIQIPGDVANLQGLALPVAVHDLTAITEVDVSEINYGHETGPDDPDPDHSAFLLWLVASEGAVIAARLTSLGRRTALARTAHFYLELWIRLRLAGLGTDTGYPCPMTQYLIADVLGLTPVHVNRVLRELRTLGIASHQRGWFSLLDRDKLAQLAGFDGAYLGSAAAS